MPSIDFPRKREQEEGDGWQVGQNKEDVVRKDSVLKMWRWGGREKEEREKVQAQTDRYRLEGNAEAF